MLAEERRKTDLCFFGAVFARHALSCRQADRLKADRQRGEKLPHETVASGIFFVTLCDLKICT